MARITFSKPSGLTTEESAYADSVKAGVVAAHATTPFTTTTLLHAHLLGNPRMRIDTSNTQCVVVQLGRKEWDVEEKTLLTINLS